MAKMRKDLVKVLIKNGLTGVDAKKFVQHFIDAIGNELLTVGKVKIPHMGTITMVNKAPRIVRADFIGGGNKLMPSIRRPSIRYTEQFSAVAKGRS